MNKVLEFLTPWRQQSLTESPAKPQEVAKATEEVVALWNRISEFPIDKPGAVYPLSHRLADEQKWDLDFALRVIEEYRKFMFLCVTMDHMCTPSYKVDQAWHLHLLYTRSYWMDWCENTLRRKIHHEPSNGGESEDNKYAGHFHQTLQSYRKYFGEPPHDIWGCCR